MVRILPRRRGGRKKTRQLWGQDFSLVKDGLAEDQVVQFVNDLLSRHRAQLEGQKRDETFPTLLSRRILADAEREAENLRLRAKAEVKRLTTEAQQQAQKIISDARSQAKATAEQEAKGILDAATQKAHLTETQALQMAHLFLIRAREEIRERLASDTKEVYHRLLSSLQNLLSTAQDAETEWTNKKIEPWWGTPLELKDYQAALLEPLMAGELNLETLPTEEPRQESQAQSERVEEPLRSAGEEVPTTEAPAAGEGVTEIPAESPTEVGPEPLPQQERAATPEQSREEAPTDVGAEPLPQQERVATPEQSREEAPTDVGAEPLPQQEETSVPEPLIDALQEVAGMQREERPREERPSEEPTPQEAMPGAEEPPQSSTVPPESRIYSGEVDLVIMPPVSAARITGLYAHLQSMPDLKVLRTAGSWDRGTVVTVAMERPLPLINLLSDIPMVQAVPGTPGASPLRGLREKGRSAQWVGITFAGEDAAQEAG